MGAVTSALVPVYYIEGVTAYIQCEPDFCDQRDPEIEELRKRRDDLHGKLKGAWEDMIKGEGGFRFTLIDHEFYSDMILDDVTRLLCYIGGPLKFLEGQRQQIAVCLLHRLMEFYDQDDIEVKKRIFRFMENKQ